MQERIGHTEVPFRTVLNSKKGMQRRDISDTGRRRKTASAFSTSFLTEKIGSIRPTVEQISYELGVALNESCTYLFECFKNFMQCLGEEFDYSLGNKSLLDAIPNMVKAFENSIEKYGLRVSLMKSDIGGTEILSPVIYYEVGNLEGRVVIFYASPVDSLSKRGSELFARFISFLSYAMGIGIGYDESVGNWYLDTLFQCYMDDPDAFDDDDVIKQYHEGDIAETLQRLREMPKPEMDELINDIKSYLSDCPSEETDLFSTILEGLPIVSSMEIREYDYIPDDDGFDKIHENGSMSIVYSTCILYSENDGMDNTLIECINNDCDSGENITGWNLFMLITPKTTKDDIVALKKRIEIADSFEEWQSRYYQEESKFDRYELRGIE